MASPERYDLALDLTALDRIVEFEPEDLTLTAECGVTIETLRARLVAAGQELPLEASLPARATLGGVLATNASGPRRRRFGAPRDRILGARFALSDGTLARAGGRVVKNVAGYGIHRLLCGSRGGLGVIVEASLKLLPAPASRVALVYAARASEIADATRWTFLSRLEPAIVSVVVGALGAAAYGGLSLQQRRSRWSSG
jgi:glycolate oxidase FAD binding subunit